MSFYSNAVGNYLMVPNESFFDITNSISVMAWINIQTFSVAWQAIFTKGDSAWRFHRQNNTNFICFHLTGVTGGDSITSDINVNDGRIHHIAATYNGSRLRVFVDGVADIDIAASGTISTNNAEVRIGSNSEQTGREFRGSIEDVRLYNRGLSIEEIQTIYSTRGADSIVNGLIGRWLINEGFPGQTITGTNIIKDHTVNGNNLTPVGSPIYGESVLKKRRLR